MAYWVDIYSFSDSVEFEYRWVGRNGAKGEQREKKCNLTPEQMNKLNQMNREKRIRRLIKANFVENDLWTTLKYQEGHRPSSEKMISDRKKFYRELRKWYKSRGKPLKYIDRMEIGKNGGPHIHTLINRIEESDIQIKDIWRKITDGFVNFRPMDEIGPEKLGEYITKVPTEDVAGQLSMFNSKERKQFIKYSCSRNLARPEPERKKYVRRTMRKILENGIKAHEGYYIEKESIVEGINAAGYHYLYYTEKKIRIPNEREREKAVMLN